MRLLAVLVVAVLLAGCGGKDSGANKVRLGDGTGVSLDLPPEQRPAADDIRGAVSGIVVDDAIFPVAGATVRVDHPGLALEAVTRDDGRFVLEDVPPGLLAVKASKDGHATGLGTLNVRSGEVTKSVLMAPRVPVQRPYHTTIVIDEFHSALEAVVFSSATQHLVAFDRQPQGVVIESFWEGVSAPPPFQPLTYRVNGESEPGTVESGGAPNPMHLALAADWFAEGEYALRVQVAPGYATAPPEATGRIFVTSFYVEAPPEGWSFLAGDA